MPELFGRLLEFRVRVTDLLLDQLAAAVPGGSARGAGTGPHPPEEVRAVALVLRMLTKERWGANDLRLFDACWRTTAHSDLFAGEFEAERHHIGKLVESARPSLRPRDVPTPRLF